MESKSLNICITGAAGRIAYNLYNPLCSGQIFGPNCSINLNLLDLPRNNHKLKGILLELEDGAYHMLDKV